MQVNHFRANPRGMAINVSPATRADIVGCLTIDPLVGEDRARGPYIKKHIGAGRGWIARRNGAIVGFAIMGTFFGHEMLELIRVAEEERRTGVGSALMDAIEAACAGDRLFTSTNESNAPMRALCLKRGWLASGHVDNLDPGDPELFFVKLFRR